MASSHTSENWKRVIGDWLSVFAWFLNTDALSRSVGAINAVLVQWRPDKTTLLLSNILETGPGQALVRTPQEGHLFRKVLPSLPVGHSCP